MKQNTITGLIVSYEAIVVYSSSRLLDSKKKEYSMDHLASLDEQPTLLVTSPFANSRMGKNTRKKNIDTCGSVVQWLAAPPVGPFPPPY